MENGECKVNYAICILHFAFAFPRSTPHSGRHTECACYFGGRHGGAWGATLPDIRSMFT